MTNLAVPTLNPALLDQATQLLLAPAALEFRQLSQVLADIHVHHVDYADLYFQYSRLESWSLEEGIVKSGSYSIDRGVGVRAISGEKTAFAYSDDISLDALAQAATATRAIGPVDGRDAQFASRSAGGTKGDSNSKQQQQTPAGLKTGATKTLPKSTALLPSSFAGHGMPCHYCRF